jgi:hypothetical protein
MHSRTWRADDVEAIAAARFFKCSDSRRVPLSDSFEDGRRFAVSTRSQSDSPLLRYLFPKLPRSA